MERKARGTLLCFGVLLGSGIVEEQEERGVAALEITCIVHDLLSRKKRDAS